MSINIGSINDPVEVNNFKLFPKYQGIAHFLEHMLFLGTEAFPEEGEYKKYLTQNSGSCNAYTSISETNFYFSVANHAIYNILIEISILKIKIVWSTLEIFRIFQISPV